MSIEKTLSSLSASTQVDERHNVTGLVEVYGVPDWLRSDRFIRSILTPAQARKLAIDLLQAAERAALVGGRVDV